MTHSHIGDHTMTTQTQEAQVRAAFEALIAAAENVEMFRETSYVAKNGRRISIQADDGERVDLVHSDQTETLKAATDAAKLALAAWSARPQSEVKDAWRPIQEADSVLEIIALAEDGSVYRMDTTTNHRGELRWQTWGGVSFVDGYLTHFIPMPPIVARAEVQP
jgi:hypothetical protein